MTVEQMQILARAATDSYFVNMDANKKASLMENAQYYMDEYFKIYDIALNQLSKYEAKKNATMQPFGEDLNPHSLKF